ncbi:MAG: DUF2752 domain-containing protein [Verrucomicrobiota bacterium]|nr:DUF2752 domain-containing protein [Verrucomicrobiota bacterium]
MRIVFEQVRLNARALWWRGSAFVGMTSALVALRAIEPGSLAWLPLPISCGAATGLPCIFCGTTRGLHHLLRGEFGRALYFNWLCYPLAAFLCLLGAKLLLEVFLRRRLIAPLPRFSLTPRSVTLALSGVCALWIVQVSLALALHKHELLNPHGPLYVLFVR